jgi:hypothetical protein
MEILNIFLRVTANLENCCRFHIIWYLLKTHNSSQDLQLLLKRYLKFKLCVISPRLTVVESFSTFPIVHDQTFCQSINLKFILFYFYVPNSSHKNQFSFPHKFTFFMVLFHDFILELIDLKRSFFVELFQ